jgi:hypothetical protein
MPAQSLTSAALVVLPEEHQHEYEELLRGFRDSFQPQDPAEDALVLRLAQAHWRSLRSRMVETRILNISAAAERIKAREMVEDCPEHLDPHNAIAVGFMVMPAERWQMYLRYDTAVSRDFFKTLDALTKLQRARRHQRIHAAGSESAASQQPVAPLSMAAGRGAVLSDSGIRSVSQNTPAVPDPHERQELTDTMAAAAALRSAPPAKTGAMRPAEAYPLCACAVVDPTNGHLPSRAASG